MRSRRAPDGDRMAVGHGRWTGAGVRFGCAVIAAVAAVTLGLGIHQELQVSARLVAPAAVNAMAAADKQEMCLFRALRHELPKGAAFYDPERDATDYQRLAELATLWAVPERSADATRWRVAIVPGRCARVGLKVWRA
jgi:hypothetical protein